MFMFFSETLAIIGNHILKGGMVMTYSALEVARYIIYHEAQQGRTVSNLRLQKLLYFVQAKFIADGQNASPCFYEPMEAWGFGPVVREVYYAYRYYGGAMIPPERNFSTMIALSDRSMIDEILDDCAQYSTSALVDITHSQTPWQDARRNPYNKEITTASIYNYFKGAQNGKS